MAIGQADYLALGDWNAACYRCGAKFKASMLRKNWQGYYTCDSCWEPRHPQDFVRGVPDFPAPPWTQSQTDVFTLFCTLEGRSAIVSQAVVDCAVVDFRPST